MFEEFLFDYNAKEWEEYERYKKKALTEGLTQDDVYPPLARFKKINYPLILCDRSIYFEYGEKIWSQIPFAGTLLIPLHNVPKENLLRINGFDVDDIPELIKLAKIGKVQFALPTDPYKYIGLDYLEPIFRELKPPMMMTIPFEALADDKTIQELGKEFDNLVYSSYGNWLKRQLEAEGLGWQSFLSQIHTSKTTYSFLKLVGMGDLADDIYSLLSNDPEFGTYLIQRYSILTEPLFHALRCHRNMNFSKLNKLGIPRSIKFREVSFPVEIGKYLMNKITFLPSSYEACMDVIAHYQENDLYRILEATDKGINDRSKDRVIHYVNELDVIMNNIWSDANKIKSHSQNIRNATITIGLIGAAITPLLSDFQGLLAGFGFNVVDKMFEMKGLSMSDRIARWINRDYLINTYDFKKKYSLPN